MGLVMILPYKLIVAYPLLTLNTYYQTNNNFIPYKPYTTTSMMTNHDIKVYESFWNNIIKEESEKILGNNE